MKNKGVQTNPAVTLELLYKEVIEIKAALLSGSRSLSLSQGNGIAGKETDRKAVILSQKNKPAKN